MPLVHSEKITGDCLLLVWKLTETEDFLRNNLPGEWEDEELKTISHPQKKREWLAGRLLLNTLVNKAGQTFRGIWKDEHGKPFLVDSPHYISLTHTLDYIAAVLHYHRPIGIDMEKKHEKLIRTAAKFLTDEERELVKDNVDGLCTLWCSKEAIFKLNGRKKVSFKDDITICPFSPEALRAVGDLHDQGRHIRADLHIRWIEEYCLVVAL